VTGIFGEEAVAAVGKQQIRELHEKIGELTVEGVFCTNGRYSRVAIF
jgi:hypothetical protein